jgi:hypothetical protein
MISKILCKGLEPYFPMFVEEAMWGQDGAVSFSTGVLDIDEQCVQNLLLSSAINNYYSVPFCSAEAFC